MFLLCPAAAWPDTGQSHTSQKKYTYPEVIQRYFLNFHIDGYSIVLKGSSQQVQKLTDWLNQIAIIPEGRNTLRLIADSGNQLLIFHSAGALSASGRTRAPMSSNLTNNIGENTEILFDTRIPESGSHLVYDRHQNTIAFTAIQNLYHELVHARHLMNGTLRYFDFEGQAIEEENLFRLQQGKIMGEENTQLRAGIKGLQYWWPDADNDKVRISSTDLNHREATVSINNLPE